MYIYTHPTPLFIYVDLADPLSIYGYAPLLQLNTTVSTLGNENTGLTRKATMAVVL